ncbi:MAG: hypothetical protein ACPL07_03635, partial [Candidatus Bathyarchaeia archaeon]
VAKAVNAIVEWVKNIFMSGLNTLIDSIKGMFGPYIEEIAKALASLDTSTFFSFINFVKTKAHTPYSSISESDVLTRLDRVIVQFITSTLEIASKIFMVLIGIRAIETTISAVLMALSPGVSTVLKKLFSKAAEELLIKALIVSIGFQIVGEILDLTKPEVLENFAGKVFKGALDVSIFVGALYDIVKKYITKKPANWITFFKSIGGALALTGFIVNIVGMNYVLEYFGIEKGWPVIILDIATLAFSVYGAKEYYKGATSVQETILDLFADITKDLEKALTIIGLFGTATMVGLHIGGGKWRLG